MKGINNKSRSDTKITFSMWKILAILSSIAAMVYYAETMLMPAIPDLIRDFHVSYSTGSWFLAAYLIPGTVMTPIAGKLSDIYGKKRILLLIMMIYTIGISVAGFATNYYFLLVARVIQGIGMSMLPIAFSIIRDEFPRDKFSIGQGVITSMFAGGAVIGLLVGGIIIQNYGWEATFFTVIPAAVSLLVIIHLFIRANKDGLPKQKQHGDIKGDNLVRINHDKAIQVDIKGAVSLGTAITSFLLFLTYMDSPSSNNNSFAFSIQIMIFLSISIISLLIFLVVERRTESPLLDFNLLLHGSILLTNLLLMIVGISMFLLFQTIPILARSPEPVGFAEDAANAANIQLPFAVIILLFGITSGFIISKLGSLKPTIAGTIITSMGFISLLLFHSTGFLVSISLAIVATGFSLTIVGATNIVMFATPRQFSGVSMGTTYLMRIIGNAMGPTIAGMYLQTNQSSLSIHGIIQYFPSSISFKLVFLTGLVLSISSITLVTLLRQRMKRMGVTSNANSTLH
jgi:MFS family permease